MMEYTLSAENYWIHVFAFVWTYTILYGLAGCILFYLLRLISKTAASLLLEILKGPMMISVVFHFIVGWIMTVLMVPFGAFFLIKGLYVPLVLGVVFTAASHLIRILMFSVTGHDAFIESKKGWNYYTYNPLGWPAYILCAFCDEMLGGGKTGNCSYCGEYHVTQKEKEICEYKHTPGPE